MKSRGDAMVLIALICIFNRLSPEDLESIAHQLAEFDAVNDSRTGEKHVESY